MVAFNKYKYDFASTKFKHGWNSLAMRETYVLSYIIYTSNSKVVNEEYILNTDQLWYNYIISVAIQN